MLLWLKPRCMVNVRYAVLTLLKCSIVESVFQGLPEPWECCGVLHVLGHASISPGLNQGTRGGGILACVCCLLDEFLLRR